MNIPAKELDFDPVSCDEGTIAEREQRAEVCAAPEEERRDATRGKLQDSVSCHAPDTRAGALTLPLKKGKSAIALSEPIYAREPWCEYLKGRIFASFARRFST